MNDKPRMTVLLRLESDFVVEDEFIVREMLQAACRLQMSVSCQLSDKNPKVFFVVDPVATIDDVAIAEVRRELELHRYWYC